MTIKEQLEQIKVEVVNKIGFITNKVDLNNEKALVLGKKGPIAAIMANMRNLTVEERKEVGQISNVYKQELEALFNAKLEELNEAEINAKLANETIDVTLPGVKMNVGVIHPLNQTIMELEDLFIGMGYEVAEGPEIETDGYCFEKLNLPKGHPARDMQDTFYIDMENLLRSQTSPVQARVMEAKNGAPIKIVCPGKVYRRDDDDATHSHQFMQFEVLGAGMVNNNVLRMSGYDPQKIQGFAFGVGVERVCMLKYGVDDIRNFYTNDVRFLHQFKEVK